MRIRSKLGMILLVPLVVLVAVASLRLYELADDVFESDDMVNLVEFNTVTAELRYELQKERSLLVTYLRSGDDHVAGIDEGDYDLDSVQMQAVATDEKLEEFSASAGQLPDLSDDIANRIDAVSTQYESLEQIRTSAEDAPETTSIDATSRVYQRMVSELVTITDVSARVVNDPEIARQLQAIASATVVLEQLEEERAIAINVGDGNKFLNNTRWKNFVAYAELRVIAENEFKTIANRDEQLAFFYRDGGLSTEQAQAALGFETKTVNAGTASDLDVDADIVASYDSILENGLHYIEDESDEVLEQARSDRDSQIFQLLLEAVLILAAFVLATVIALVIARNMNQGLRRLREGALDVAHVSLPQAVAQMRDAEAIGNRTPEEVAADAGTVIDIEQRDEIGNVAHSFNIVHTEAIRIAAEQAALRANVSQMFTNLARRSQNLVDRLIGHLDHLERGEENPDRLAELFQLDHLATRMRRNDENLLVLAGADSTRQERHPAPIGDILQAAQSEVEQYTRIEFGHLDTDREIRPAVVNDLVHLIAELMDNATAFSPPESSVLVEAEQMRTSESPLGAIRVRIIDSGIGMPEAQINDINSQLSESADVIDLASSRMMGLVVVARLAQRHDVRVELRPGDGRGTVAEVILSDPILTDPKLPERDPIDSGDTAGPGDGASRGELLAGLTGETGALPSAPESPAGLFDTVAPPNPQSPPPPAAPSAPPSTSPFHSAEPTAPSPAPAHSEPLTGEHNVAPEPGFMFRPGGLAEEPRPSGKVMEVTGEIVSSEHVALPKIQLEAAPPPEEPPPPAWPDTAAGSGTEAPRKSERAERVSAVDATTELPIFREVESAWFKAVTPAPKAVDETAKVTGDAEPSYGEQARADTLGPAREAAQPSPPQPTEGANMYSSPPPPAEQAVPASAPDPAEPHSPAESGLERRRLQAEPEPDSSYAWRTAADDGWNRVDSAFAEEESETTSAGLPKRRPMERLVPGGVEETQETVSAQKRNPEGIRGLLSAYHRGVQRGRGNDGN